MNLFRPIHFGLLLCLISLLGSGCIFSPKKNNDIRPDKPPVVYARRNTPSGSVLYLSQAWTNRDSVRIDSVYADDYQGSSVDLTDTGEGGPQTLQFTKTDEVHTVGALARSSEITYTNMDLKSPGNWTVTHYLNDPPDWRTVQVLDFKILILGQGLTDGYSATSPEGGKTWIFEFTLRPTYPAWAAGEPVWEIVKWVESRDNLF